MVGAMIEPWNRAQADTFTTYTEEAAMAYEEIKADQAKPAWEVALNGIGRQLDEVSWERLEERYPDLASQVERAVSVGAPPEHIRRYALARGMPSGWANWLEQAARAAKVRLDA